MNSFKEKYMLAKRNGKAERFRGVEISKEISKTVSGDEQQALQTNMINDLINGAPFSHMEEWNRYQEKRAEAKAKVDDKIAKIELEINSSGEAIE